MCRNGYVYKQMSDWLQTILDFDYNESNIWTDNSLIFRLILIEFYKLKVKSQLDTLFNYCNKRSY